MTRATIRTHGRTVRRGRRATPSPRPSGGCATSPPCASRTTRCSCGSCRRTTPSCRPTTSTTASSTTSTPSPSPTSHWAGSGAPGACVAEVLSPDRDRDGWQSPALGRCSSSPTTCRSSSTRCGWCSSGAACASTCSCTRCCGPSATTTIDSSTWRRLAPTSTGSLEAWTQIEIDRTDAATAAAVEADILRAVDDVQRVVADFDADARPDGVARRPSTRSCRGSRRPVRLPRRRRLRRRARRRR